MTNEHNYLTAGKTENLGHELSEIMTDIEIMRAFTEGFERPSKLTESELYSSYARAFQFFELLHSKTQRLEKQLDDITVVLLESGNYETLKEYVRQEDMNLPKIRG